MTRVDALKTLDVFEGLSHEDYEAVAAIMREHRFVSGECIFREGEPSDTFYLILEGAVSVTQETDDRGVVEIARVEAGGAFGEMALVDPDARAAAATAVEDTRVLLLLRREFFALASAERHIGIKVFLNMGILLTDRLRNADRPHVPEAPPEASVEALESLGFHDLLRKQTRVFVELVTGRRIGGLLVNIDRRPTGEQLTVVEESGGIHVIPYHAIAVVQIDDPDVGRNGGA